MKRKVFLLVATAALFCGCGAVQMQKPTVKNYARVKAMADLRPITVAQLRQLIDADTVHYKVVVLTSTCCGYCIQSMCDTYPGKMAEGGDSVRWVFVESDYSTAQYMPETYAQYHIDAERYWIDDTLPQYRTLMAKSMGAIIWNIIFHYGKTFAELGFDEADNRDNNVANAIADTPQPITSVTGVPATFIFDRHNRLKCTHYIYSADSAVFGPTDIRDITVPVTRLDYSKIDTLSYCDSTLSKICTPEGCN